MLFSDPLTLAIVSLIVGIAIGAFCSVIAILILNDLREPAYPSDDDLEEMYDAYMEELK